MSPSSSPSDPDPFGFLVGRGPVAAATSATAWLQALLDAEAALAGALADVGAVPARAAETIAAAARVEHIDAAAVFGAAAEQGGSPVIPLVDLLRAAAGDGAAEHVHIGATSQDIVDTAAMLVVRRCSDAVADGLGQATERVADLAERHRDTAMIGRTLLQHAVPTTFGAVAGRWDRGLCAARRELDRVAATLPVQLGGPVGDLAGFGEHGPAVVQHMAGRLGLAVPDGPWHTQRAPVAAVAGAWGGAAAAVSGVALDIVLLAQSDVGEVAERADGAGGSSSMPHKRNPIAAVSARAAALQAPGLVATLLQCAGGHELERAAGAWHGEWPALRALLRATGSAVDWLATRIGRLSIDEQRMAANLAGRSKEET